MFKYLWLIFLIGIGIVWGIASIINVIKTLKENYECYIINEKGTWKDVFDIWDDLEGYACAFFMVLVFVVIFGSFVVYLVSLSGGAK